MNTFVRALALACVVGLITCDVYLHFPPGSNDRNRENQEDREDATRCFNSQNNAAGGKGIPLVEAVIYKGSILAIEWTAQHGCNGGKSRCEYVIQLLCDYMAEPAATFRDNQLVGGGADTNRVNTNAPLDNFGADATNQDRCRYEPETFYRDGVDRGRNTRLYYGNNEPNANTGQHTRQNAGGTEYGLEIQEDRDYYPWWHPTPFFDLAIFTENTTQCDFYVENSQNRSPKNTCANPKAAVFEADCNDWQEVPAHGYRDVECLTPSWMKDNHHGLGGDGKMQMYNWTVDEDIEDGSRCQIRLRYNVSSNDIDWWADVDDNLNVPFNQNDPEVNIADDVALQLTINTAQFFRTFEDRTSIYRFEPAPAAMAACRNTWNMSVKGRRGNIVQAYPLSEYDYQPPRLEINQGDCVHFWWSGQQAYANPEGQGANRDAHNWVEIAHLGDNVPITVDEMTFPPAGSLPSGQKANSGGQDAAASQAGNNGFNEQVDLTDDVIEWRKRAARGCGPVGDTQLDNAPFYCDMGIVKFDDLGEYYFFDSRNNAFTNRSQKGHLIVTNGLGLFAAATIAIGAILVLAGLIAAGSAFYAKGHPNSAVARIFQNGGSRGSGILSSSGSRGISRGGSQGSRGSKGSGYNHPGRR